MSEKRAPIQEALEDLHGQLAFAISKRREQADSALLGRTTNIPMDQSNDIGRIALAIERLGGVHQW